jgi:hypothetical protein
MPVAPPSNPDSTQVRRWLQQHIMLGLLQLAGALLLVFSIVLTSPGDLGHVSPVTWLVLVALLAVSALRVGLFLARGRPNWRWLEREDGEQ